MKREKNVRAGERGAITIKALFGLLVLAAAIFVVIKIVPVYTEQQEIIHDADELARISAVRDLKNDKIKEGITKIIQQHELPEGSITLISKEGGRVQIGVNYSRNVNFLVTDYTWEVQYVAKGKDL
ncbi:MAG TPA: hypothetical protein VNO70_01135 [Blastocatellia bacterium]|nr:hypothetical protein [Blastocatellia bacterium]